MENKFGEEYLLNRYEGKVEVIKGNGINLELLVNKDIFLEVSQYYKSKGFAFLADITSVDFKEYFMVVYQLFSYNENKSITIKVKLEDHENPEIDSLTKLWDTADWHEREVYDLMGIKFSGHPNLKRILMWEGFKGHPLRKDFPVVSRKRSWEVE